MYNNVICINSIICIPRRGFVFCKCKMARMWINRLPYNNVNMYTSARTT